MSAHRWEVIIIGNGKLFDAIMNQIPPRVTFPRLKDLRVWRLPCSVHLNSSPALTHLGVSCSENIGAMISLQAAPSLSYLFTHALEGPEALVGFGLPWNQIIHFESSKNDFLEEQLPAILQMMPNLISFTFIGKMVVNGYITLPHLRTLRIGVQYMIDKNSLKSIMQFLKRSDCSLEDLTLTSVSLGKDWKAKQLQSLKKIHLFQPTALDQDLLLLTRAYVPIGQQARAPGTYNSLLLKLKKIQIRCVRYQAENVVRNLIAMLKSRLPPI
ncbi:hypothetical protein BDQ17DRAFT_480574 [Cyathus striatus]|nr:hypothetical protein BDQ17DRAFT_480574 [Cyathus striatus]